MSIDYRWIVVPCFSAIIVSVYVWFRLRGRKLQKDDDPFPDGYCPPKEVPITGIRVPYGRRDAHSVGVYQVSFKTTGKDRFFWLAAPEIVKRCQRHQQQIPFIIGCDKDVSTEIRLDLGDSLLIK